MTTSTAESTTDTGQTSTSVAKPDLQTSTPSDTVTAALTGGPATADLTCRLYSDALLRASYGNVQGCVAAIKAGGSADSVKILSAKTSGSTATVVAMPSGGPSSGEKLTYTLVMENGQWRLDKAKSNVKVGP